MNGVFRFLLCFGLLVLSGWTSAQTVEYIHTDALGSIVAVTDASGNVVERREYEPYGAQLTPVVQDGPGYTGHVQDAATGLTYMQQRYYDPMIGRFLSVDPVAANGNTGTNFNRYWYVANNPYRHIDPDGRWTIAIGGGGSASAIAGVSGAGQITFSFPTADPATWRVGALGQGGGQAGTDIGAGLNLVVSYSEADSAEEMAGGGPEASSGGTLNVLGISAGYERTLCNQCKVTHAVSFGGALKALPFEFHSTVTGAVGATILGSPTRVPSVTVGAPVMVAGTGTGGASSNTPNVTVGEPSTVTEPPQKTK